MIKKKYAGLAGAAAAAAAWCICRNKKYPLAEGYPLLNKFFIPGMFLSKPFLKMANSRLADMELPACPCGIVRRTEWIDDQDGERLRLTICQPEESMDNMPCLVYFHGGGFFAGSKNMGDPLAATEATYLLDDICAAGYNIVNVDYALVPDYRFPVPLIQANKAFAYIQEHADEYHLNMDNVVIMGSSAGAIMASQLGSIITNPEYAELLGITPALKPEQVKAVVIDDAPLDYKAFSLATKIIIGNYVKGSIYLSEEEIKQYDNIQNLTANYPAAVLLGSEYRHDMEVMHEELNKLGCEHLHIDPYIEHGLTKPHCFVSTERTDPIAKDAFDRMISFLNEKTK